MSGENVETIIEVVPEKAATTKPEKNSELNTLRAQMKEMQAERETLTTKLEFQERERLEKDKNYELLYKRTLDEKNNEAKMRQEERVAFFDTLKYSAVETQALKSGIDPDYLDLLTAKGLPGVEVDRDGSRLSVLGAKEFVEAFKIQKPKLFKMASAPNINGGRVGQLEEKKYTVGEALKLEKTDPVKYAEVMKNWGKYKA